MALRLGGPASAIVIAEVPTPPNFNELVRAHRASQRCADALRTQRARQRREREAAGADWQDTGYVFTTVIGPPVEPDNLRRSWYRVREAAGLAGVRLHDLRHCRVTLLLNLGTPPHVVRAIAEHSDIDVTMTIYAHVSLDEMRTALSRLDDHLR